MDEFNRKIDDVFKAIWVGITILLIWALLHAAGVL